MGVLDTSPVSMGATSRDALLATTRLARATDELLVTSTAFDVATRVHTLESLAELWPGLGAGRLDGGGLS